MKSIVFISYSNFPNGDAAAIRLSCIAKLFMMSGFKVRIITMSRCDNSIWHNFCGIEYISIRSKHTNLFNRIGNVLLFGIKAKRIIKTINHIDSILITSPPLPSAYMFKKLALQCNYKLYADRTEWYSPGEFFLGRLSPQYIENDLLTNRVTDSKFKVISISKYLHSYYNSQGITSVRIPAIMDTSEFIPKRRSDHTRITIIYAGSPANKDSLSLMIEGLNLVSEEDRGRLVFKVIGITRKAFISKYKNLKIPSQVEFFGRISREEVLNELSLADFSALLRNPDERFAKAGFPSKVAESLSSSTPMIANLSSDLGDYLIDNKNAIIIENYSRESFAKAIERVAKINKKKCQEMQDCAKQTAVKYFDYRAYTSVFSEFVSG